MSSFSQRSDSASTSTNRRNGSARIVNAVRRVRRLSAVRNLRRRPSETALFLRIGLDMLNETLAEDRDAALGRAACIAAGEEA